MDFLRDITGVLMGIRPGNAGRESERDRRREREVDTLPRERGEPSVLR